MDDREMDASLAAQALPCPALPFLTRRSAHAIADLLLYPLSSLALPLLIDASSRQRCRLSMLHRRRRCSRAGAHLRYVLERSASGSPPASLSIPCQSHRPSPTRASGEKLGRSGIFLQHCALLERQPQQNPRRRMHQRTRPNPALLSRGGALSGRSFLPAAPAPPLRSSRAEVPPPLSGILPAEAVRRACLRDACRAQASCSAAKHSAPTASAQP